MATYSKTFLSQSSNGKNILITATGAPYNLIHTTQNSSGILDEVWIYGTNPTTSDVSFTLMHGGSGISGDCLFNGVIEAYAGSTLLTPGLLLNGDNTTGSSIYGLSSVASGINIFGYINRIS